MDRSRLKVLYISRGYTTHDHRFLTSFVRSGWAPIHLPLLDERLDTRLLPEGSRTIHWTNDMREPATQADWDERQQRLEEIIDTMRPDVVIAGPVQSGAYLAALAGARPLVTVSWGSDLLVDADSTAFASSVTRYTLDSSDALFGDCRAVREAAHRHSSIADDRIVTIPWGIDLARFGPGESSLSLRSELGWTDNRIFISTRSWEPPYAIDVLIRAFALVHPRMPDARLLLLGDGSLDLEIHALVKELGLREWVHAHGRASYDQLPDYFRVADVYVSAAISDGTSISLLEAMACGLPAVVTDNPGNREWVEPGINGELARPGDAESLAAAMLAVVSPGADPMRMREVNIAAARRRANWEANFPEVATLVESLTAR